MQIDLNVYCAPGCNKNGAIPGEKLAIKMGYTFFHSISLLFRRWFRIKIMFSFLNLLLTIYLVLFFSRNNNFQWEVVSGEKMDSFKRNTQFERALVVQRKSLVFFSVWLITKKKKEMEKTWNWVLDDDGKISGWKNSLHGAPGCQRCNNGNGKTTRQ